MLCAMAYCVTICVYVFWCGDRGGGAACRAQVLLPAEGAADEGVSRALRAMMAARATADMPLDPNEARVLEQVFAFAAIWAFGSCLSVVDGEVL